MTAEIIGGRPLCDHSQKCARFEQSLLKRMTSVKRSSTNSASGSRLRKPGGPSLGRNPGAQKAASTRQRRSNLNLRDTKGRHNFPSRARCPALFLFWAQRAVLLIF